MSVMLQWTFNNFFCGRDEVREQSAVMWNTQDVRADGGFVPNFIVLFL